MKEGEKDPYCWRKRSSLLDRPIARWMDFARPAWHGLVGNQRKERRGML